MMTAAMGMVTWAVWGTATAETAVLLTDTFLLNLMSVLFNYLTNLGVLRLYSFLMTIH
ncbi:hypothetical protein EDB84DRAFT_1485263 [Lactarius hengduanensis]|nr:hypothetical protein EDB84DRAFT_1523082 [Lactarius hengduanensis]KAH9035614.1 hypothetical protein EDB84DRAFT_1485263 [Lactarius hengduanensis]